MARIDESGQATTETPADGQEWATSSDGARIAFRRRGRGDPVLLVHGGPSSGEAWAPVTPHLATRFTLVAMDRRGRGASTEARTTRSTSIDRARAEALDGRHLHQLALDELHALVFSERYRPAPSHRTRRR